MHLEKKDTAESVEVIAVFIDHYRFSNRHHTKEYTPDRACNEDVGEKNQSTAGINTFRIPSKSFVS